MRTLMTSLAALAVSATSALAGLTYSYANFDSVGTAWTDAGDEYAYHISSSDSFSGLTTYTFNEYGSAPGYSSGATVGVEHTSTLTSSGFTLTGKAYTYVSDDYGYASCWSNGEALVEMSFTIDRRSQVTITGSLGQGGTGSATALSNYFEIRNAAGTLITSADGVENISVSRRLPAGTYTLYVSTSVYKAIDFSGGDVYESAFSTFDVTFNARPIGR